MCTQSSSISQKDAKPWRIGNTQEVAGSSAVETQLTAIALCTPLGSSAQERLVALKKVRLI